jgi:hypothetical protein
LVLVGFSATVALVVLGPFPVAMVGLDTAQITNSYPPRVTLAFLGMFQAGLVLLAEPILKRWMARVGAWTVVVAVSAQIMTLYLWHLTAMVSVRSGARRRVRLWNEPQCAWWWSDYLVRGRAVLTLGLVAISAGSSGSVRSAGTAMVASDRCGGNGVRRSRLARRHGIADEDGLNGIILTLPVVGCSPVV